MSDFPRLLGGPGTAPLARGGAAPGRVSSERLLAELEASGLKGRGGSAFATAAKARLVRAHASRAKAVVVNAMEGEPASRKDATLLSTNAHLVLDGAEALASIIGAREVIVCVARSGERVLREVEGAIGERPRTGANRASFVLESPPARYVAGEESALAHWLDDHEARPAYRARRPVVLGARQRSLLVDNAETCAHVALIARHGADWFRALGTNESPGTTLVTVSGAVASPTVLEVVLGTPLSQLLSIARAERDLRAVLLGGYGGAWLDGSALETPYANESLALHGASVGAGVVVALARDACGIAETASIVRWMAGETSHQCGPCAFGLPALASDLAALARGAGDAGDALERLERRCGVIEGRGACRHPDGVIRLIRSALSVFGDDARAHSRGRPCAGAASPHRYARMPDRQALGWT